MECSLVSGFFNRFDPNPLIFEIKELESLRRNPDSTTKRQNRTNQPVMRQFSIGEQGSGYYTLAVFDTCAERF